MLKATELEVGRPAIMLKAGVESPCAVDKVKGALIEIAPAARTLRRDMALDRSSLMKRG